jgi:GNAT superfamily N-acetyltransferase
VSDRIIRELAIGETHHAHRAMLELRPHIGSSNEFARRVDGAQRREGYRLVASFEIGEEDAAAVAGFRTAHSLSAGSMLYCDDLSTRSDCRRRGHAAALLDFMLAEAQRLGCDQFQLDSGVGANRLDAHRLYFNKLMRITAYHFARPLR